MSMESTVIQEAWGLILQAESISNGAQLLLKQMRRVAPVQSVSLFGLEPNTTTLLAAAYATIGNWAQEPLNIVCVDSRWKEFTLWIEDGSVLRQYGTRRSGKLAYLAPEHIAGEVIGLPIRGSKVFRESQAGVMVIEVEQGRAIHDDTLAELEQFVGPAWLLLQGKLQSSSETRAHSAVELDSLRSKKDVVVGADGGLKSVMERVELVASADMPVLILGDTGTGKEVVARAIHQRSPRASKPFIRVNCGAIPSELIDSQLFGHERGSFTGASDQRKGWFERADGGTLFLDEIGELPLAAQVRLLRVLQEHQIERVGGQDILQVDVRIVAATHRDLASMVHKRTFREDLWYRINMFPILLPRLCERIEDIPALAKHFAKKAAANFGLPYVELGATEIKQLIDYRWPGNIRELQAVIDRAVILGRGTRLDVDNALGIGISQHYEPAAESDEPTFYEVIPEQSVRPAPRPIASANSPVASADNFESLDESIRRHIEKALVLANGQIEGKRGAAQLLNINPHTLRAKMRKLGIPWNAFRS
jgi:hydrogenase-4 transcriptional activator